MIPEDVFFRAVANLRGAAIAPEEADKAWEAIMRDLERLEHDPEYLECVGEGDSK